MLRRSFPAAFQLILAYIIFTQLIIIAFASAVSVTRFQAGNLKQNPTFEWVISVLCQPAVHGAKIVAGQDGAADKLPDGSASPWCCISCVHQISAAWGASPELFHIVSIRASSLIAWWVWRDICSTLAKITPTARGPPPSSKAL